MTNMDSAVRPALHARHARGALLKRVLHRPIAAFANLRASAVAGARRTTAFPDIKTDLAADPWALGP